MSLIQRIRDFIRKLQRHNYTAFVDGKIIKGCGDCPCNTETFQEIPFFKNALPIPTHRCNARIDSRGEFEVIFDPFNVPYNCPHIVTVVGNPPKETIAGDAV